MTENSTNQEEPDNEQVRADVGGWISGPCFTEEQVTSGEAARIMDEHAAPGASARVAREEQT